jgi:coproporphyrinogen III oxidase-like Fe-S oxidoreductase
MESKARAKKGKSLVESLYLSGGDPLLLSSSQFSRIKEALEQHFEFSPQTEFTIRATPGAIEKGRLEELAGQGVNRISMGIPSFSDRTLSQLNESFTAKEAVKACEIVREISGLKERSIEIMYGIPHQTMEDLEQSLKASELANPTHLTISTLPLGRRPTQHSYDPSQTNEMYDYISRWFTEEGWDHYDFKNLAKSPNHLCKHNIASERTTSSTALGSAQQASWTTTG